MSSGASDVSARRMATLNALVERMYPETDWGPGASRLGAAAFARQAADSASGQGDDWYRAPPFVVSADRSRGWQWPLTPQQMLDDGLDRLDAAAVTADACPFAILTPVQQDAMIARLEAGAIGTFAPGAARAFFDLVHGYMFDALFVAPAVGSYSLDVVWQRLFPEPSGEGPKASRDG